MAAVQSALQQQLAEVQEAAAREGRTALVQASRAGLDEVLALLLQPPGGGRPPITHGDCRAAFLAAAAHGHPRCLRVLLDASPAPVSELLGAVNKDWHTPLACAAAGGHAACVELLLSAAQGTASEYDARLAVVAAASHGRPECLAVLLQHRSLGEVDEVDEGDELADRHCLALCQAAFWGQLHCVRQLLAHGPPIQLLDEALCDAVAGWMKAERGRDPARRGSLPSYRLCTELLLSQGAMLSRDASASAFERMRPVIQDLAARALAPDMANEAAAQAVQMARAKGRGAGSAAASAAAFEGADAGDASGKGA